MDTIVFLGVDLYPYGLAIAAGGAAALALFAFLCRRANLKSGTASLYALFAVPLCFVCARLGFCLASYDWLVQEGAGFILRVREGGFMLYGALAGMLLSALITARITGEKAARVTDCACVPAMLLLCVSRFAECMVEAGYGWGVEDWFMEDMGMSLFTLQDPSFFCRFPFAVQDYYGFWNWAVFVPEALAAIVMLVILCRTNARPGGKTMLALVMYAVSQALFESMRQDAVLRWGFVRVNQIIGAVVVALAITICLGMLKKPDAGAVARSTALFIAGMAAVAAMEFALEDKILEGLTMDMCYVIMAAGCAAMFAAVYPLWKKVFAMEKG